MNPDITRMLTGVLRGGEDLDRVIEPYTKSASAPYQAATKQAVDQILRSTPVGGRQSTLIADAYTKGALQRGQDISQQRQQWIQSLMQMAMGVYGQPVEEIGRRDTQKPGVSFGLGPVQAVL